MSHHTQKQSFRRRLLQPLVIVLLLCAFEIYRFPQPSCERDEAEEFVVRTTPSSSSLGPYETNQTTTDFLNTSTFRTCHSFSHVCQSGRRLWQTSSADSSTHAVFLEVVQGYQWLANTSYPRLVEIAASIPEEMKDIECHYSKTTNHVSE